MSITATASQVVLNALAAMLEGKIVFTAHDVKLAARKKTKEDGTKETIEHDEVRNIVHTEYTNGEFPVDYNRQDQLELSNGHVAICYYPDGKVAEDHENAMYPTNSQSSPVTSPASVVSQNTTSSTSAAPKTKQGGSVKDGNGFICSETSKGVINIPDEIVKAVTPNAGSYDIQVDGGGLIYKVADGKGRLRIASSKLGTGSKFRLEVVTNTITVTQI
jgi:hypothetical protein